MKAVVYLNGTPPSETLLQSIRADLSVCADGAYTYLRKYNIVPDIVLGDFDSFKGNSAELARKNIKVIRFPADKDKTDGELAFTEAVASGAEEIDVYGADGGRLDQTLANLALLFNPDFAKVKIRVVTERGDVSAFSGKTEIEFKTERGTVVSLVPFGKAAHIISTYGLKYPLKNQTLYPFKTLGISNEAEGEIVRISLASGEIFVCVVKQE